MPMCQCPDCKQFISSRISICIHCGADVDTRLDRTMKRVIVACVALGVGSIVGLMTLGPHGDNPQQDLAGSWRADSQRQLARERASATAHPLPARATLLKKEARAANSAVANDTLQASAPPAAAFSAQDLQKFAQPPTRARFRDANGQMREQWVAPVAMARFAENVAAAEGEIEASDIQ